jgi:hypothetical protein
MDRMSCGGGGEERPGLGACSVGVDVGGAVDVGGGADAGDGGGAADVGGAVDVGGGGAAADGGDAADVGDAGEVGAGVGDASAVGVAVAAGSGERFHMGIELNAGSSPSNENVATYFALTGLPLCRAGANVDETAVSIAAAQSRRSLIVTTVACSGIPLGAMTSRTRAVPVMPMASRDEPRLMSLGSTKVPSVASDPGASAATGAPTGDAAATGDGRGEGVARTATRAPAPQQAASIAATISLA